VNRVRALLDERHPAGGRVKAWIFLAHPGPSLLVATTTVAIARLAVRGPQRRPVLLRVGGSVLATQVAIGVANDWADVERDRIAKPHKPLVRGMLTRRVAALVGAGSASLSVGLAAGLGPAPAAAMTLGLGSGLAYDAGLKRSAASVMTWWGGMLAVPLVGCTAAGRSLAPLRRLPLLSGLTAIGLHCANGLPDLEDDARGGARSLPVRLGAPATAAVALLASGAATAVAYHDGIHRAGARGRGRTSLNLAAAGMLVALTVSTAAVLRRGAGATAVPFRVLAPASAGLAWAWLAIVLGSDESLTDLHRSV